METEKELKCVAVHEEKLTLVQKAGLAMLKRRAERLLRLIELNAPTGPRELERSCYYLPCS